MRDLLDQGRTREKKLEPRESNRRRWVGRELPVSIGTHPHLQARTPPWDGRRCSKMVIWPHDGDKLRGRGGGNTHSTSTRSELACSEVRLLLRTSNREPRRARQWTAVRGVEWERCNARARACETSNYRTKCACRVIIPAWACTMRGWAISVSRRFLSLPRRWLSQLQSLAARVQPRSREEYDPLSPGTNK